MPDPDDVAGLRVMVDAMAVDAPELMAALDEFDPGAAAYWSRAAEHLRDTQSVIRREVYAALVTAQAEHGAAWAELDHAAQVSAVLATVRAQRRGDDEPAGGA